VAGGFDYESHWDRPNLARLRIQGAVPYDVRSPIEPSNEYYAFKVLILRSKSAGADACAGCDVGVRVTLESIQLFQPPHRGFDPELTQPDLSTAVAWQSYLSTTPVLVSLVTAEATPERVHIIWQTEDIDGAEVQRREVGGAWQTLAHVNPDGQRRLGFEDTQVTPGVTYDYRLAVTLTNGMLFAGETRVAVPRAEAAVLALRRLAVQGGALTVWLSLASDERATLELFDVGGRRLESLSIEGGGAGENQVRLAEGQGPRSGFVFARLTQGPQSTAKRFVVVH
jgi:hypothetical protein